MPPNRRISTTLHPWTRRMSLISAKPTPLAKCEWYVQLHMVSMCAMSEARRKSPAKHIAISLLRVKSHELQLPFNEFWQALRPSDPVRGAAVDDHTWLKCW
ncbi:MAG: hypothetical protein CM15mP103_00200 [Gammaproteobacteria bacterium]|nr:MAG: hypothetical protein CM15mP103_00200 [Gammaproteobacteria bacterium]